MTVRFVDTNVLLYRVSRSPEEHHKGEIADRLVGAGEMALSTQVSQEFYVR